MSGPVRIQLSRRKGWRLQEASLALNGLPAVKVDRSTRWGNPFIAHDWQASFRAVFLGEFGNRAGRNVAAVKLYRMWLTAPMRVVKKDKRDFWEREVLTVKAVTPPTLDEIRRELGGRNLACWCACEPCHASVLLELAAAPICAPTMAGEAAS